MLDAAQAKVVAYTTPDGEILCAEHTEKAYGDEIRAYVDAMGVEEPTGTSFDLWEAFDAAGLTAISRFDLGEIEAERLYYLEPTDLVEWLNTEGLLEDFAAMVIESSHLAELTYDVVESAWLNSELARERCDKDGEVI